LAGSASATASSNRVLRSAALLSAGGRAHLIGASGAGMRALTEVMHGAGWRLSGSDMSVTPGEVARWQSHGVPIYTSHHESQVPLDADLVVHSLAIPDNNPEVAQAQTAGIATYSYPQMLGRLMAGRYGLAVAGTHGKSTTTAMAGAILTLAGHDPTVLAGAAPLGATSGGRVGGGKMLLVEACEYRRAFLNLRPRVAIVLGIELDHVDCYQSLVDVEHAFGQFVERVPPAGLVLANADCPTTLSALRQAKCRRATFGFDAHADWQAGSLKVQRGRYRFTLRHRKRDITDVTLRVPGKHNVLNALAAAAMASEIGCRGKEIGEALSNFGGLQRRLETLGTFGGVSIVDDYAHHPTEITAALTAVRKMFPERRIVCVFQPHQSSRTRRLLDELAASLHNADKAYVAEVFQAREPELKVPQATAADLAAQARQHGVEVGAGHALDEITEQLSRDLCSGDVLVTLGAGDIRKVCDGLIQRTGIDRQAA
jgi:UDP-N-acetylmuramate--alanine ligase